MATKPGLTWVFSALAAFSGFSAGENGQENPRVTNGDFELDKAESEGIGMMPSGWPTAYGAQVLQVVPETRPGSKGKQCLKIGTSEKVQTGGAYSELVPFDPTKGLAVSGWVKPGDPEKELKGLYFGVGWFDRSRRPIIIQKGTSVNYLYLYEKEKAGDWYRMSISTIPAKEKRENQGQEIPPDAAFFDIRIFALNYPAPVWFDDIEARVMSEAEVAKEEKARAAAVEAESKRLARLDIRPRPPADLDAEWLVGWKGTPKARDAADELARTINKVIEKKVSSVPWQANQARRVFVITEAALAPKEVAIELEGKRLDAFLIRYPVQLDGQQVCLMVSQDEDGYDLPVYYFLTRFMNVHWVGPGELGEVLETQPDWRMPEIINVLENPDFEMRQWYSPSFTCRQWLAASNRMGFHHALGYVFHPDRHGDTPEVYPLVGGKRYIPQPAQGAQALSGWQPCTGHPKSIEIALNHVLESFEKNPRSVTVSLSVNDGAGNTCECNLCRAQDRQAAFQEGSRPDLSDRFFRFYNAVIERAVEKNPRSRIAVLGYGAVKTPPKEIRIHPRISVFHVCPSVQHLRSWKEAGANPNLYLWLWDGGFLTIRPDLETVAELIREAHQLGGIGFYSECVPHWIISAPKFYAVAHLLWDTTRDPNQLLDRYFQLAYGEAAPPVRSFFARWYEIYRRRPPEEFYWTSLGWRGIDQFKHLRRDDFDFMDGALHRAGQAKLSEKQSKRLEFLRNYYELMRINGDEYLAGQELSREDWLSEKDPDTILSAAERIGPLTPRFNELYREYVLEDESGWMFDAKYYQDPKKFTSRFIDQMRNTVSSNAETAIDRALDFISQRWLQQKPQEDLMAFWEEQIRKRPALAPYIGPQVNRLKGVQQENIVLNGSFEEGEPGDPPQLHGWDFYQFYGMVKGVTARHEWKDGSGRTGGKAIGLGEGRYPEMKAIIEMEEGARYQLSFWYKSEKRGTNFSFSIFSYDGDLPSPREIDHEKIHSFLEIPLEPTHGEWKQVTRALKPTRTGKYVIQLAVYYQKSDWLAWFDDIEIRKL